MRVNQTANLPFVVLVGQIVLFSILKLQFYRLNMERLLLDALYLFFVMQGLDFSQHKPTSVFGGNDDTVCLNAISVILIVRPGDVCVCFSLVRFRLQNTICTTGAAHPEKCAALLMGFPGCTLQDFSVKEKV